MLFYTSLICGIFAILLTYFCLRGGYHIAKAIQSGDELFLKALVWAELRIGLLLASFCVVAATEGKGIKVALVLQIVLVATRLPADLRALRR